MKKEVQEFLKKYSIHTLQELKSCIKKFTTELDPKLIYSVAELLKMHDGVPAASLKEYLALSDVEELPSIEVKGKEALEVVLKDFQAFKALGESIRLEADEANLYDVVSAMESDLEQFNKAIWFIKAMLK